MIKKSVDEAIFDTVLKQAFEDAALRDGAESEAEAETGAGRSYPEEYKKIERKKYNKVKHRSAPHHAGSGFIKYAKRAAAVVLIAGSIGCCAMLAAPNIRAEFFGMISRFFDECFSITLDSNATTYETDNFMFKYIPDSYSLTESSETPFQSRYLFSFPQEDTWFEITICDGSNVIVQQDSEHTTVTQSLVNGYVSYIIQYKTEKKQEIIWTDNEKIYLVAGNLSETDLIKISENISRKNNPLM